MTDGDDTITPFVSITLVFDAPLHSFLSIRKRGSVREIVSNGAIVQTLVFSLFIIIFAEQGDLHTLVFHSMLVRILQRDDFNGITIHQRIRLIRCLCLIAVFIVAW